jgi:hypothetical protein
MKRKKRLRKLHEKVQKPEKKNVHTTNDIPHQGRTDLLDSGQYVISEKTCNTKNTVEILAALTMCTLYFVRACSFIILLKTCTIIFMINSSGT